MHPRSRGRSWGGRETGASGRRRGRRRGSLHFLRTPSRSAVAFLSPQFPALLHICPSRMVKMQVIYMSNKGWPDNNSKSNSNYGHRTGTAFPGRPCVAKPRRWSSELQPPPPATSRHFESHRNRTRRESRVFSKVTRDRNCTAADIGTSRGKWTDRCDKQRRNYS